MTAGVESRLLISAAEFVGWAFEEAPSSQLMGLLGLDGIASSDHLRAWADAFSSFRKERLDETGRRDFWESEREVRAFLRGEHDLVTLVADGWHWFAVLAEGGGFTCRVEDLGWLSLSVGEPAETLLDACLSANQMLMTTSEPHAGWAWRGEEAFAEILGTWTPQAKAVVHSDIAAHLMATRRN